MSHESARLKKKLEDDEVSARLINWGRWLRFDDTLYRLGFPHEAPFVFSPRKGGVIADLDAEHIEWVISSLAVSNIGNGRLYAFILKVEYAEKPEGLIGPVSTRAEDVRRRFKRPCAERTYYHHLEKARDTIKLLADPRK